MEIKVGQWARGYCTESEVGRVVIGKITKIVDNCLVINDDYWLVNGYGNKIKTADNLVDLLGVGDVVSLYDTRLKTIYEVVIENELRLHSIVELINEGLYKITAIELYENRVAYRL